MTTATPDELATRRKRLLYQSRHRGTQEADLLIGGFAERHLPIMTATELDEFERILAESDVDLVEWLSRRRISPARLQGRVWELLKNFKLDSVSH